MQRMEGICNWEATSKASTFLLSVTWAAAIVAESEELMVPLAPTPVLEAFPNISIQKVKNLKNCHIAYAMSKETARCFVNVPGALIP